MRALSPPLAMSFQNNYYMAVSTSMTSDMQVVVADNAITNWQPMHHCQESNYIRTLQLSVLQDLAVYNFHETF